MTHECHVCVEAAAVIVLIDHAHARTDNGRSLSLMRARREFARRRAVHVEVHEGIALAPTLLSPDEVAAVANEDRVLLATIEEFRARIERAIEKSTNGDTTT